MPFDAILAISIPAAAMLLGASIGLWRVPGPRLRSASQHLAAGVIFAAVATELIPPIVNQTNQGAMLVGFGLGVVLMLGIRWYFDADDEREGEVGESGASQGMLVGLGVDVLIDGLLVAMALSAGEQGGLVLAAGVSFETLFLGLALAAVESTRRRRLIVAAVVLALLLVVGGVLGLLLVTSVTGGVQIGLLSFGCAALLYLVTEELLVEAHRGQGETLFGAALFFVGFGATLAIAGSAG